MHLHSSGIIDVFLVQHLADAVAAQPGPYAAHAIGEPSVKACSPGQLDRGFYDPSVLAATAGKRSGSAELPAAFDQRLRWQHSPTIDEGIDEGKQQGTAGRDLSMGPVQVAFLPPPVAQPGTGAGLDRRHIAQLSPFFPNAQSGVAEVHDRQHWHAATPSSQPTPITFSHAPTSPMAVFFHSGESRRGRGEGRGGRASCALDPPVAFAAAISDPGGQHTVDRGAPFEGPFLHPSK